MRDYGILQRYLESLEENSWNATFAQIEAMLGEELPASARDHSAWWANNDYRHTHTFWLKAGWHAKADRKNEQVVFTRQPSSATGEKKGTRLDAARLTRER